MKDFLEKDGSDSYKYDSSCCGSNRCCTGPTPTKTIK